MFCYLFFNFLACSSRANEGGRNRIGRREKWPKKKVEGEMAQKKVEGEIGGKHREEGENVR